MIIMWNREEVTRRMQKRLSYLVTTSTMKWTLLTTVFIRKENAK